MPDSAGEVGTSSLVMYSCGPLHMDEKRQDDELAPTCSSSADTECNPEDLPEAMGDREGWRERIRDIHDDGVTWWWWWWWYYPKSVRPISKQYLMLNPFWVNLWVSHIHLFSCVFITAVILLNAFFSMIDNLISRDFHRKCSSTNISFIYIYIYIYIYI